MSDNTKKPNKKAKWDNIQKLGFWGIIIVSIAFWGGIYLGGAAAANQDKMLESAKSTAVEEYKATLKDNQ